MKGSSSHLLCLLWSQPQPLCESVEVQAAQWWSGDSNRISYGKDGGGGMGAGVWDGKVRLEGAKV